MRDAYKVVKQIVESTNPKQAMIPHQRSWVRYRESRAVTGDAVWVFADGSSTGRFGAIVIHPQTGATRHAGSAPPTATRNIAAELNGALLGLEAAATLANGLPVIVVQDYIGVAAWIVGAWQIRHEEVADKVRALKALIERNGFDLRLIHHAGHQTDGSDFTKWNAAADAMCARSVGQRFSMLTVVERWSEVVGGHSKAFCKCLCDCGSGKVVREDALMRGSTKSCGCATVSFHHKLADGESYLNFLVHTYTRNAARGRHRFDLSRDEFKRLIVAPCAYCGAAPTKSIHYNSDSRFVHHGIDRVDSAGDYVAANCATACKDCNRFKRDLSLDAFLRHALLVAAHGGLTPLVAVSRHPPAAHYYAAERLWLETQRNATNRKLAFSLSLDSFYGLVTAPCAYCRQSPTTCGAVLRSTKRLSESAFEHHGLDRVDPARSYEPENCVPCCKTCNYGKHRLSAAAFVELARGIARAGARSASPSDNRNDAG